MKKVVAVCAALWVVGCAHQAVGPQSERAEDLSRFYPLAVGNEWTYEINMLGEKREQTVKIERAEGGFFVDSQGGQLAVDPFGIRDQKRYLLHAPLESGREWNNVVSVSSVEHYKILETGAQCQCGAGTYSGCVRVEARNRVNDKTTLVNEVTFAPGVGMVRVEVFAEIAGRQVPQTSLVLKSFHLAPGADKRL